MLEHFDWFEDRTHCGDRKFHRQRKMHIREADKVLYQAVFNEPNPLKLHDPNALDLIQMLIVILF